MTVQRARRNPSLPKLEKSSEVAASKTAQPVKPGALVVEEKAPQKVALDAQPNEHVAVGGGDVYGGGGPAVTRAAGNIDLSGADPAGQVAALRASSKAGNVALVLKVDGALGPALAKLGPLNAGDAVVVTGRLELRDVVGTSQRLQQQGVTLVDAAQVGGPQGKWMVGGSAAELKALGEVIEGLAAGGAGWVRGGETGAGTLLGLAHDAGARTMMQSYLEGFELLATKTGMGVDLDQLAEIWRFGSVVRAELLDAAAAALTPGGSVEQLAPVLGKLGDAKRAVGEGILLGVNLPAISSTVALDAALKRSAGGTPSVAASEPRPVGMSGPVPKDAVRSMGMIGLGRMGANIVRRIAQGGEVKPTGYNRSPKAVDEIKAEGLQGAYSLAELVDKVRADDPKGRATLWISVPHDAVDSALSDLLPHLKEGDIVIDGGNSNWRETRRRADELAQKGITLVDSGTSGGIWGLKNGYSLMVGGEEEVVQKLRPIFESMAPGKNQGWGRVGETGAGHFTKMVHNGIEYGTMEATAEAIELVERASAEHHLGVNASEVIDAWRSGTDLGSWLLDLTAEGLSENPGLGGIGAVVEDNGEGRWTALEGLEENVSMPVLNAALNRRFASQTVNQPPELQSLTERILAVMRSKFGGHRIVAPPVGGE